MQILFALLILVGVTLIITGVAFVGRRNRGVELEPPRDKSLTRPKEAPRPTAETAEPTRDASVTTVEGPPEAAPDETEPALPPELEDKVVDEPVEVAEPVAVKPRFRDRLTKAREAFSGYIGSVLSRSGIDDDTWEELEEALIRADVGVGLTTNLLGDLRARVKSEGITTSAALVDALKDDLKKSLSSADRGLRYEPGQPNVWLFVGVNGVGKTTTIGKLGKRESEAGRSVVMAAGDTFRAAAGEQLELWAERVGADLVRGAEGADPGSVIFDAIERAAARNADLVLADTAGRLHTKVNLMEELKKVRRIAERPPALLTEVLLVIDATTGQNGLVQAKQFTEAVGVTGVVLTKLDGTARGGIALAIQTEMGLPIKLVGLGETAEDLIEFDPEEYVEALFA
jgi:fused signal recognition particle receptor